jgi:hypothetical protein
MTCLIEQSNAGLIDGDGDTDGPLDVTEATCCCCCCCCFKRELLLDICKLDVLVVLLLMLLTVAPLAPPPALLLLLLLALTRLIMAPDGFISIVLLTVTNSDV